MIRKNLILLLLAILFQSHECSSQNNKVLKSASVSHKIDTLLTPEIGGIKQVIEIKTDDSHRPILFILSGGPGSSMMNNADNFTSTLKNKFTIVQWDQRNAGKTLTSNPSPIQPSVEQMQ